MKIITVCGSFKYKDEILDVAMELATKGNCVLTPIFPANKSKEDISKDKIEMLGKMHKEKIRMSDAILVVNINNYIGDTTKSEIEYAKSLNKEIIYYSDLYK